MKKLDIEIISNGGPFVFHNYPCPILHKTHKAVYNMSDGFFEPSWEAQKLGYKTIHINSWIKRIVYKVIFQR